MRPIHVSVIAGLSLATLGVCQAGIEGELSGTVHVGASNEYIFRGVDQGGGAMAEAGLSWGGLSLWGIEYDASIWYASTHSDSGRRNGFDEFDYTSRFSRDFGFANFAVGNIYYNFYRDRDRDGFKRGPVFAQEVFFSVSREFWQTEFAFTYFWDADEDNDGYSELTIDRSFALSECLQLALGGTASYDWETSDMHHYGLSAALNWEYNDILTVSPYVSATWAQDGAKYGAQGNRGQGDELFGGIILSASF